MKIYFEDGKLRNTNQLPIKPDFIVNAEEGVNANINYLDNVYHVNPNGIVYTNSIFAFSNQYAWNEELKVAEIYIRAGEHMLFTRIDELTERELREGHNLAKMYVAGEFDNDRWANSTAIEEFFDTDIELCHYLYEHQLDIYKELLEYLSLEYEEVIQ